MKKGMYLSFLLIILLGSSCQQKRNEIVAGFKPMEKDVFSCLIEVSDKFGDIEVTIKNVTLEKVSFSKPRMMTGTDLNNSKGVSANSLELQLKWETNRVANLQYATFKKIDIRDEIINLNPGGTIKLRVNLKNTLVERRCNLVPFDECFSEGTQDISVSLSIVRVANKGIEKICESNTAMLYGKYIF